MYQQMRAKEHMWPVVVEGTQNFWEPLVYPQTSLPSSDQEECAAVSGWRLALPGRRGPAAPVAVGTDLQAAGGSMARGWLTAGWGRRAGKQGRPLKVLPRPQVSSGV